mmetsp:Transcript_48749/g.140196  ORF Transcript_48749/g.140196 Transcript_48749/m.140196 type:complete len:220 (+) Transcript_48749:2135-2794(+)
MLRQAPRTPCPSMASSGSSSGRLSCTRDLHTWPRRWTHGAWVGARSSCLWRGPCSIARTRMRTMPTGNCSSARCSRSCSRRRVGARPCPRRRRTSSCGSCTSTPRRACPSTRRCITPGSPRSRCPRNRSKRPRPPPLAGPARAAMTRTRRLGPPARRTRGRMAATRAKVQSGKTTFPLAATAPAPVGHRRWAPAPRWRAKKPRHTTIGPRPRRETLIGT